MTGKLKALELQGYKTFANRTLFEFAERVTVVVGPNGSGKSNIADSLRWVLGEQSFSLLRGKKTEDMIFSGSESRPRLGMASATITFDNSDGWLPIDFSEVAITRRAYRDGDNEYLVNGQRVRLKDVSELLAQSGLAERTYTVIGQGLVDAALSLKAEERRRLFEEAAGIGLHRARREEALRRLEATRRNLERLQDILSELQPRLHSLERQARRAQEFAQVRADLRLLLRDWYGYHWHHSQRDLAAAQEAARAQEKRLAKIRGEHQALENQVNALRNQLQASRLELAEGNRQLSALHTRRQEIGRDLAVAEERSRSLHTQGRLAEAEASRLEGEAGLLESQFQQLAMEEERVRSAVTEAEEQAQAARQALQDRMTGRRQLEQGLQVSRQELARLNARSGEAQARLLERQAAFERMKQAGQAAEQELVQAEAQAHQAEATLEQLEQALKQARQEEAQANQSLARQREKLEKLARQRQQLDQALAAAQTEQARWEAQCTVLEQAEATLTGYSGGARLLLEAARQKRLGGARGVLSSFLETTPELETALAAALGDYLEAVVLEPGDDEIALDLLNQERRGRAALLPVATLKPQSRIDPGEDGDVGILGIAADLVRYPPELQPAVELLLGQVLVVRDRQTARQMASRQPAGVRVVTLRGEVFHASGPIQAGGAASESGAEVESSLLSRSRQRREAAAVAHKAAQQVKELTTRVRRMEQESQAALTEEQAFSQAVEEARRRTAEVQSEQARAQMSLEQARRQQDFQRRQMQALEAERAQALGEAGQLEQALAALEAQVVELHQAQSQMGAQLAALALDELQTQVAHWETTLAVAEQAINELHRRRAEAQASQGRLVNAKNALAEREGQISAAQADLESNKLRLRQDEEALAAQIHQLQSRFQPAESALYALENSLVEHEKNEATARQGLNSAEHLFAQARILLARRQEELVTLRRRIEEDFGIVAFDYVEQVSGPTPLPLDGIVEQLPTLRQIPPELEESIKRLRAQLRRMGSVNVEALAEFQEVRQRYDFLKEQVSDLHHAEEDVRQVIAELDSLMQREFRKTFQAVATEFREIFTRLFGGGSARLLLTDPDDLTETGIDIEARLPGRRSQGLSLLSGGERSLTAVALVFSLLKVSPTPFCVLDEVDAMLDEANVGRFLDQLRELGQHTQFVIITHNRNTVQAADIIYGVTMGRDSVSQVLSLRLDQVDDYAAV